MSPPLWIHCATCDRRTLEERESGLPLGWLLLREYGEAALDRTWDGREIFRQNYSDTPFCSPSCVLRMLEISEIETAVIARRP